jgi:hypothetical protein
MVWASLKYDFPARTGIHYWPKERLSQVFFVKSKASKTRDFENRRVAIFREKEILDGQVERGES